MAVTNEQRPLPPDMALLANEHPEYVSSLTKHRTWNYCINILDTGTYAIPLAILSEATVVPFFVSQLTNSALIIGLLPTLNWVGIHLPQIFGAYLAHGQQRRKSTIIKLGWLERLGILGIFLATLTLDNMPTTVTLALFLLAYTALWGFTGLFIPAYSDFYAKHILVGRGFFYGVQTLIYGVMGLVGAGIIRWQLDSASFPRNFQALFGIAVVSALPGMIAIHNMREVTFPRPLTAKKLSRYLGEVPALLRQNRPFVRVLLGLSVLSLGKMSVPFVTVYAIQQFSLPAGVVAIYSGLLLGARSATALLWGYLTDKIGYRWLWISYGVLLLAQAVISWWAADPIWFYLVFLLIGAALGMETAVRPETIYQLSPPSETSRFVGLSNTFLAIPLALGPLLAGTLIDLFSYRVALAGSVFIAAAGLPIAYWLIVRRQHLLE